MPGQPLQCPGQPRRGSVVPGDEQRHQLIAQLRIGHPATVLVGRPRQRRQRVGARGQLRIGTALGDFGVQQPVGFLDTAAQAAPRAPALQAGRTDAQQLERREVQQLGQHLAQRGQPGGIAGSDDQPHDHLERDLRHLRRHRERLSDRPAGDIGRGDLGHHLGLAGDRVAVERLQHQPAPVAVHLVVDHQNRRRAQQAGQHRIRFARMVDRRITSEDLLDVGRVVEIHQRSHSGYPQCEGASVTPPVRRHETWPEAQHQHRLDHGRQWRPWRQRGLIRHESSLGSPALSVVEIGEKSARSEE